MKHRMLISKIFIKYSKINQNDQQGMGKDKIIDNDNFNRISINDTNPQNYKND